MISTRRIGKSDREVNLVNLDEEVLLFRIEEEDWKERLKDWAGTVMWMDRLAPALQLE